MYRAVTGRVDGDGQDSIGRLDRRARNSYSLYPRSMMVSVRSRRRRGTPSAASTSNTETQLEIVSSKQRDMIALRVSVLGQAQTVRHVPRSKKL